MMSDILVNTGSGNEWLVICAKPLPEPMPIFLELNTQEQTVFEIVLCGLMDSRSINELNFGGPALILVDRRNMQ